jgi:Dolichyl-phosphate-mannose-protein mannosyltransferase
MPLARNQVRLPEDPGTSAPRAIAHESLRSRLHLLLPALLTVPTCLSLALQPDHGDATLYLYVGQKWAQGTLPYVGNFDNKPPGIFALIALVSHLSPSLWLIALTQFVFVVGVIAAVGAILKQAGAPKRAVFLAALCLALALNIPNYAPGNMPESYMNCPMVFSMFFFLRALNSRLDSHFRSHQLRDFFWAGLCSGFACMFKPFGLSAALAQAAFLLLSAVPARSIRSALVSIGAGIVGAVVIWIPPILYFWRHAALTEMLDASFLYNLYYGSSSQFSLTSLSSALRIPGLLAKVLLPLSTMIACLSLGSYQAFKTRSGMSPNRRRIWALLALWFAFGLFLALAAGRGYWQYFLSLMPALALAAGMFFWWGEEQSQAAGLRPAIAVLVLAPLLLAYLPGLYIFRVAAQLTLSHPLEPTPDEIVASQLRALSSPANTLLVFGYDPWILYSSQLSPTSRFRDTHYVYDSPRSYLQIGNEILHGMQTAPPDFIVVIPRHLDDPGPNPSRADTFADPFKARFMQIVSQSYVEISDVQGYQIYRRK